VAAERSLDSDAVRFEQYKLAVEMADRISARRAIANSFFLTAASALVTAVGSERLSESAAWAGIALSVAWWVLLRSYRQLSGAKWKVIADMEKRLPSTPFSDEWECLKQDPIKRWRPRYAELSTVEQVAPVVFIALFVLALVGPLG
jgi:hypothetical protein